MAEGFQATCDDCDTPFPIRRRKPDAWADLNSHTRIRRTSRARVPRCPAIAADEKRRMARAASARDNIPAEFPSVKWGVDEWLAVFDRCPHVFDAIVDGIATASSRWREGMTGAFLPKALYDANVRADELVGIR